MTPRHAVGFAPSFSSVRTARLRPVNGQDENSHHFFPLPARMWKSRSEAAKKPLAGPAYAPLPAAGRYRGNGPALQAVRAVGRGSVTTYARAEPPPVPVLKPAFQAGRALLNEDNRKDDGSELVRWRRVWGESVKGGHPPFHKRKRPTGTRRSARQRAREFRFPSSGFPGPSSGCGAKRRVVRERGLGNCRVRTSEVRPDGAPAPEPLWWSGRPDLNRRPLAPQASALPDCATSRRVGADFSRRGWRGACRFAPSAPAPAALPSKPRGRRRPARASARAAASAPPAARVCRSSR